MEQVSFRVHIRIVSAVCSTFSPSFRWCIEKSLLAGAVVQLAILLGLHYLYISSQLKNSNLIAEAIYTSVQSVNFSLPSFDNVLSNTGSNCLLNTLRQHKAVVGPNKYKSSADLLQDYPLIRIRISDRPDQLSQNDLEPSCGSSLAGLDGLSALECVSVPRPPEAGSTMERLVSTDDTKSRVYLFALERGHLNFHPRSSFSHGVQILDLVIPNNCNCFGYPAAAWILKEVIGYDTVMVHWSLGTFGQKGFVYNTFSKQLFNLQLSAPTIVIGDVEASTESQNTAPGNATATFGHKFLAEQHLHLAPFSIHSATFKLGTLVTSLFLFFASSTVVSLTLRETQARMLRFTFLLQYHIQNRLSYKILVLNQIAESLVFVPVMVGMLFFLSEFFADQLLAFIVLSLVWCGEVYAVITVRTATSLRVFPQLYATYMLLFLFYFFHYPCGFTYLGLYTTFLFVLHAMFYFWNRFEIPALGGSVSATVPRAGMVFVLGDDSDAGSSGREDGTVINNSGGPSNASQIPTLRAGSADSHDSAGAYYRPRLGSADSDSSHLGDSFHGNAASSPLRATRNNALFDARERAGSHHRAHGSLTPLSPEVIRRQRAASELMLLRARSSSFSEEGSSLPSLIDICDQSLEQSRRIQRQQLSGMLHGYSTSASPEQSTSPPPRPRWPTATEARSGLQENNDRVACSPDGRESNARRAVPPPMPLFDDGILRPSHSTNNLIWGNRDDDDDLS